MSGNIRKDLEFKKIEAKVKEARAVLDEATKLADNSGISFSFSLGYGMGGEYVPKPKKMTMEQAKEIVSSGVDLNSEEGYEAKVVLGINTEEDDENWESSSDESDYGWVSSSANC